VFFVYLQSRGQHGLPVEVCGNPVGFPWVWIYVIWGCKTWVWGLKLWEYDTVHAEAIRS